VINIPATYTHHIFTEDVFKSLDLEIKDRFQSSLDLFKLFGKSFDILFFIDFKLGRFAHANDVNLYFKYIIKYIKENNLESNSDVLAYLYGSICHYVLDSVVHPYVFYKTGNYIYKDKNTLKYKSGHGTLEYMIDSIMYQNRNNKDIYKTKLAKKVFPKIRFSEELKGILNYTYENVFKVNNYSKTIYKGVRNYKLCLKFIMCSRFGVKKFFYKIIDSMNLVSIPLASNCYYYKKINNEVLNLEHQKWCYPVSKNKVYHYSFYDLYDIAMIRAQKLITIIDNYLLTENISFDKVLKEIGNISYVTGVSLSENQVMKYFLY